MIYADYAAHAPLSPAARDALAEYLNGEMQWGNPSSLHICGRRAAAVLEQARKHVAEWLGASPRDVIFTSGGTEADYIGITALVNGAAARGKHTILYSAVEHPAVTQVCAQLSSRGFRTMEIPVDANGIATAEALATVWNDDVGLVCVMAAQNETGVIEPIPALAQYVHAHGAFLFTDAIAYAPHRRPALLTPYADGLSVAGHKCGGPVGVGALYLRREAAGAFPMVGGGQENGRRGGTEGVPLCAAFAAAVSAATDTAPIRAEECALEEAVLAAVPDAVIIGAAAERIEGIHAMVFPHLASRGVTGENLALSLDMDGLAVSPGSACHSGSMEPSGVLRAMGMSPELAGTMLRLSFGSGSTAAEIREATAILIHRLIIMGA